MSASTWNFQCYQCMDDFPFNPAPRGRRGGVFTLGPGSRVIGGSNPSSTTLPFTNTITGVCSFFIRSGWTAQDGNPQGIFSIGANTEASPGVYVSLIDTATNPAVRIFIYDGSANTTRHDVKIGDEDGVNWLQDDKWYQVGFSVGSGGITFAMNGTNAPKSTTTTDNAGALNLKSGDERIWTTGPAADNAASHPQTIQTSVYPTVVLGPSIWATAALDFDDSTVRDRVWDSNGDFKNPGENGSLWFSDTYSETIPEFYFVPGVPWPQNGSDTQAFRGEGGGTGSGLMAGNIGGLRKTYES